MNDDRSITVTVTRSAGDDGAVLVLIDTTFEPDASDRGPGLRVMVNDVYVLHGDNDGVDWSPLPDATARAAPALKLVVPLTEIAYT